MIFTSLEFLIFFAITLAVTVCIGFSPKNGSQKLQHIFLLAASYVFYGWWDWRFCFLMAFVTLIAFASAKAINGKYRKTAITIGVAIPLIVLGIFKYLNFFMDSFCTVFGISNLSAWRIILPVGISFYTFQSMSYTIDVYRKKIKSESLLNVALYISFFPQLVAGPIVKAQDFIPQLKEKRSITLKALETGLQIFVMGAFKKIVLADQLSVFVDNVFDAPTAFSSLTVILGVIAYALQIYFDFSGYSDMAIGCAKCLGYDLSANFNLPYLSKNPTEFWKRWHISLSTWLQEYLYIPLGGNRKGPARRYINLMITMLLGGLWHGANWTFVIWGGLHGLGLCVHKLWSKKMSGRKMIPGFAAVILNNIFVCICWIFFRADTLETALSVLKKVFIWSGGIRQYFMWLFVAVGIEIIYTFWCGKMSKRASEPKKQAAIQAYYFHHDLYSILGLTLFFIEIMATLGMAYTGANPFVYFQF